MKTGKERAKERIKPCGDHIHEYRHKMQFKHKLMTYVEKNLAKRYHRKRLDSLDSVKSHMAPSMLYQTKHEFLDNMIQMQLDYFCDKTKRQTVEFTALSRKFGMVSKVLARRDSKA